MNTDQIAEVGSVEWVAALDKAWAALCGVLRQPQIKQHPELDADIERLMVIMDTIASREERAATE